MIGDDVEIIIVDVRGDKVRLGITAPKCIPVHRREIYDAIQREKKELQKQQEQEPQAKKEEKSGQQQEQEPQAKKEEKSGKQQEQETHNQPTEKP